MAIKKEKLPIDTIQEKNATELNEVDLTKVHEVATNNDVAETTAETKTLNIRIGEDSPVIKDADIKEEVAQAEIKTEPPITESEPENLMPLSPKEAAKFVVDLLNMGLCSGMPSLWLNAKFTEAEREAINKIQSGIELEQTSELATLMRKYMMFQKECENIPMNPDEIKIYSKNFERCFEKWNLKMSPEAALITSSVIILGGRFIPVIGSKLKKWAS